MQGSGPITSFQKFVFVINCIEIIQFIIYCESVLTIYRKNGLPDG